jgi:hypothetical protein
MPHCNALAAGLKSCANKIKEESMECPHCHNEIGSVAVILKVVQYMDLDGNTLGKYYLDDFPVTEIEDIKCIACNRSLKDYVEE